MDSPLILVDDKHVPIYRIVWCSDLPHWCGGEDCEFEGQYEIRLDVGESIWTTMKGRDKVVSALKKWCSDPIDDGDMPF